MKTALVTGSSGFIGYFVCLRLLNDGFRVVGVDAMTDYYSVSLKERRRSVLLQHPSFTSYQRYIEESGFLKDLVEKERPDIVIHLAAQAGVRFSIEQPRSYVDSNILGTYELLEAARSFKPAHLLIASTSSVYGANNVMPYVETHKADHQMSFYAATKKACEAMSHSYSHLYRIPTTIFRFFTVYGPWGRPDMALFKFTKCILEGEPIDVFNFGDMRRDFTFVEDLVEAVRRLIDNVPDMIALTEPEAGDSLSHVAPWRLVNIGNSNSVQLEEFIEAIELATGRKAKRRMLPMQAGDVPATWADASLLRRLTGYAPKTAIRDGVAQFVSWYRDYYGK